MDLDKEIPNSRFEYPKLIVSVYNHSILHVFVKADSLLEMKDIQEITVYINALGERKYRNVFEFSKYSSTDDAVRKWASDPEGNKRTMADAIVINGLDQKILADFYLKFNQPKKPTKLFDNVKEAIAWLITIEE
ncbi:MAG TPA: hypothetical protein VK177_20620 [Flavobacteriales bacterium]|nr:hypothetical protein [Flavobacteriales bacterium]